MNNADLLKELNLSSYVAFDFETTGLSSENDRIIEAAAILFENGEVKDTFVSLVNPRRPIPHMITRITGISDEMVIDAPYEKDMVNDLFDFIGDYPLIAHNIHFDIEFLRIQKIQDLHFSNWLGKRQAIRWMSFLKCMRLPGLKCQMQNSTEH